MVWEVVDFRIKITRKNRFRICGIKMCSLRRKNMKRDARLFIMVVLSVVITLILCYGLSRRISAIEARLEKSQAESALWKEAFGNLVYSGWKIGFNPMEKSNMDFEEHAVYAYAHAYAKMKTAKSSTKSFGEYFDEGSKKILEQLSMFKKE